MNMLSTLIVSVIFFHTGESATVAAAVATVTIVSGIAATAGAVVGIAADSVGMAKDIQEMQDSSEDRRRLASIGKRIDEFHVEAANSELCAETTKHFGDKHMYDFMKVVLRNAPNGPGLGQLADKMATWCAEKAATGRRRAEVGGEGGQWMEYISAVEERYATLDGQLEIRNRRSSHKTKGRGHGKSRQSKIIESYEEQLVEDEFNHLLEKMENDAFLPSMMYDQCMGYAMALSVMANEGMSSAADVFAVNSKGAGEEKVEACGSVVNSVNKALDAGLITGLDVTEYRGEAVVVIEDQSIANALATKFGIALTTITVAGGLIVTKLMDICDQYVDLSLA